jgi:hypothetical protein
MPRRRQKSFEELVLEHRDAQRNQYAEALAGMRGPVPYGREVSEEDQDHLWMVMDANLQDDAAVMQLTLPPDQGGKGMTPLAASLARWKNRADLMGVGVATIDEQIEYAKKRAARVAARGTPVTLDWGPGGRPLPQNQQPQPPAAPPQVPPQDQMPMTPEQMQGMMGQEVMAGGPEMAPSAPSTNGAAPGGVPPDMTGQGGY